MRIEEVDHPADIGFRVFGDTVEQTLGHAAKGLYSLLMESVPDRHSEQRTVDFECEDLCALTYDLLEEALVLFETERFVASSVRVSIGQNRRDGLLRARLDLDGSCFDECELVRRYDVKAVTYHEMLVEKQDGQWMIQVIVDI